MSPCTDLPLSTLHITTIINIRAFDNAFFFKQIIVELHGSSGQEISEQQYTIQGNEKARISQTWYWQVGQITKSLTLMTGQTRTHTHTNLLVTEKTEFHRRKNYYGGKHAFR